MVIKWYLHPTKSEDTTRDKQLFILVMPSQNADNTFFIIRDKKNEALWGVTIFFINFVPENNIFKEYKRVKTIRL